MWQAELFSMPNRWRWRLLERECELFTGVRGVWRRNMQVFWRVGKEWFLKRRRAPGKSGGSRWKQIYPKTPLNSSSQREGGQFYHEGDKCALELPGQTGDGESQHWELPGADLDEQEEWNGRSTSWENAAQEVGRQLDWRQLILFTWQVTRETLSSRAGQPNIFQFFYWLHFDQHLCVHLCERIFSGNYY